MTSLPLSLSITKDGAHTTFVLSSASLHIKRPSDKKWPEFEVPLHHVVWAELVNDVFELSVLAKKKRKGTQLALVQIREEIKEEEKVSVNSFTNAVMTASYAGIKRARRLKVLVNPHAGPGYGVHLYNQKVEPLFRTARCVIDVTFTTHSGHAKELMRTLPLDQFDAIVSMSGDGLVHEILNGLADHENPLAAIQTPIASVPSGSGNGLSINLLGLEDGVDVSAAALNAVKGKPMAVDLFSVTQKDKRIFSFFSQCIGLMSELDLGTEHLRFLGSNRFVYGFLRGLIKFRSCPAKIQMKVVHSDKKVMLELLRSSRESPTAEPESVRDLSTPSPLPPLQYNSEDPEGDGWITFDKPMLYMYAGKGPFVGTDLMQFPVSLPNDGCIDVVLQEKKTRGLMLQAMDGAPKGVTYWMDSQHYFRVQAYRVEPHTSHSCLAVDGEAFPFEPFQVEVHQGLGRFLSPYGHYEADFTLPPPA